MASAANNNGLQGFIAADDTGLSDFIHFVRELDSEQPGREQLQIDRLSLSLTTMFKNPRVDENFYTICVREDLLFKLINSTWLNTQLYPSNNSHAATEILRNLFCILVRCSEKHLYSLIAPMETMIAPRLEAIKDSKGRGILHGLCALGREKTLLTILNLLFGDNYDPNLTKQKFGKAVPFSLIYEPQSALSHKIIYTQPSQLLVALDGSLRTPYFLARLYNWPTIATALVLHAQKVLPSENYFDSKTDGRFTDARTWLESAVDIDEHSVESASRAMQGDFYKKLKSCAMVNLNTGLEILLSLGSSISAALDAVGTGELKKPETALSLEAGLLILAIFVSLREQLSSSKELEKTLPVHLQRRPCNFSNLAFLAIGITAGLAMWALGAGLSVDSEDTTPAHITGDLFRVFGPLLFQCFALINAGMIEIKTEKMRSVAAQYEYKEKADFSLTRYREERLPRILEEIVQKIARKLWADSAKEDSSMVPLQFGGKTEQFRQLLPGIFLSVLRTRQCQGTYRCFLTDPDGFSDHLHTALVADQNMKALFPRLIRLSIGDQRDQIFSSQAQIEEWFLKLVLQAMRSYQQTRTTPLVRPHVALALGRSQIDSSNAYTTSNSNGY